MASLAHVTSRLGNVKPETRSIAAEVFLAAHEAGHEIWFMWGIGTSQEHRTGLALDLMVRNRSAGDWVRNYLWKHRKRLRLRHVIWEQHITSTTTRPGVRVKMEDRGNPTANHYDHVHTWHFAGKYQSPTDGDDQSDLKKGSKGDKVRRLQQFLRNNFPAYRNSVSYQRGQLIEVDGVFGRQTEAWVKEFQRRVGISRTGVVDSRTAGRLRDHGYRY